MTPEDIAIERVIAAALSLAATRVYQDASAPGPYDDAQREMDRDILVDALHAWAGDHVMKIYNACPSGKVGYLDELDAMLALEHLGRKRDHRDKHERGQYECGQCPHWHLTSGPVS